MDYKNLLALFGTFMGVIIFNLFFLDSAKLTDLKEAAKVSLKCSADQTVEIEKTFSPYTGKEVEAHLVCKGGKQ